MKGLAQLIHALAKIKREGSPPLKCLILGRDRKAPYIRLANQLGFSEDFVFAGSTDEPEKYYGAADLLVHPTFYDACSLTVLEALVTGLPVVTTASNGASGVIRQGEDGWVVDPMKDGNELKEAIKHFLNEEIRRGSSNRERGAREIYSERINFDRMIEIFKEAAKR